MIHNPSRQSFRRRILGSLIILAILVGAEHQTKPYVFPNATGAAAKSKTQFGIMQIANAENFASFDTDPPDQRCPLTVLGKGPAVDDL